MALDIGEWLDQLGLGKYADAFRENEIDVDALSFITENDLKEIGVAIGARRKILAAAAAQGLASADAEAVADGEAGDPVGATAPAPDGERRQVTVLFADLSGFTALSAEMGAEATHALLNRYFEVVDGIVEGYGGSIDKHIGDNVMAIFGAPIAHANDPERAIRAALDIHEAMNRLSQESGRILHAHVGIASGQVVASGTGSDAHREYTVTGESVNLASRLQDKAGPGETLLAAAVQRAVADCADCAPMEEVPVKGFAAPVQAWRLMGLREGQMAARLGPFVGRRLERRQFAALVEECLETKNGQVVLVRGEAGIGKTRLIEEFTAIAERQGFACHKGLVLDFGVGKGQDEIRRLVRSCLNLGGQADEEGRRQAADHAISAGWVGEDDRVFLNDLLDLEQPIELRAVYDAMDNLTRNRGKQMTVAKLIERLSAEGPVLIAIEDVHWAGDLTLAHLATIGARIADCRAILVMTSRIENDPLDQAWRASLQGSPLTTLDLQPLRATEAEELASGFVETSSDFVRDCIARAGGNPLFLEQLMRNAEEGSLSEIPGSIQSLVLARMDRLAPDDKQALQAAAIVGQRFTLDVLRHLLNDPQYEVAGLYKHALIRPEGDACLFAHALIQEGAYGSLLESRRRELHLRAANWFGTRDPALYAEHLDRAGDPRAPAAYLEAARAQAAAYHYDRADALVGRGLELAEDRADRFALACVHGELLHHKGQIEDSVQVYRDALELAESSQDQATAWLGVAAGLRMKDDYDGVLGALDNAQSVAQAEGLMRELSQIRHQRGNVFFPLGRIEDCLVEHERALEAAQSAGAPDCEAQAVGGIGDASYAQGRMITAQKYIARCVDLAREHGLGRTQVAYSAMLGHVCIYLLDFENGAEAGAVAAEAAARVGHHRAENIALRGAAACLVEMGEMDRARHFWAGTQDLVRKYRMRRFEPVNMVYEATFRSHEGQSERAIEILRDAVEISKETGHRFTGPWVLGRLASLVDDAGERRRALQEGEEVLSQGSVGHNNLWFYRLAIEACLKAGDWGEAERYADALEEFARLEPLPWSVYFIAWGRALAAFGRGSRDQRVMGELNRLLAEARRLRLAAAQPALEQAIRGN